MGVQLPGSAAPLGAAPNGLASHAGRSTGAAQRGRAFQPARRLDGRVLLGLGAGALSLVLLTVGLRQVVPESQSLLVAAHDLERGAVVRADDVASSEVRAPGDLVRASYPSEATGLVIGKRLGTRVVAGQLLAPSQLQEGHAVVAPGRVQVTVPVEPYTASAGTIGSGDSVVVYSTPHQAATDGSVPAASVVLEEAEVVSVGRGSQGLSVSAGGSIGALAATAQPVWITLDLTVDDGARLIAASHLGSIDVALKAPAAVPAR